MTKSQECRSCEAMAEATPQGHEGYVGACLKCGKRLTSIMIEGSQIIARTD